MRVVVALALALLALLPASAAGRPAQARLLVESREFNLVLSRGSVKLGMRAVLRVR